MAIQHRATVVGSKPGGSGSSVSATGSASWQVGDRLIAAVEQNVANTGATPSGWVIAGTTNQGGSVSSCALRCFTKLCEAGDIGGTLTFGGTGTSAMSVIISGFFDDAGGSIAPLDGVPLTNETNTDNTTKSTQSFTTATDNELVYAACAVGAIGANTFTPPAAMTERGDLATGNGGVTLATMVQATAGATGAQTFTVSNTFDSACTVIGAFQVTPPASTDGIYRRLRRGILRAIRRGIT